MKGLFAHPGRKGFRTLPGVQLFQDIHCAADVVVGEGLLLEYPVQGGPGGTGGVLKGVYDGVGLLLSPDITALTLPRGRFIAPDAEDIVSDLEQIAQVPARLAAVARNAKDTAPS